MKAVIKKFEVGDTCPLSSSQIESIKQHVNYLVDTINEGFAMNMDTTGFFMVSHKSELHGVIMTANAIGLNIKREWEE